LQELGDVGPLHAAVAAFGFDFGLPGGGGGVAGKEGVAADIVVGLCQGAHDSYEQFAFAVKGFDGFFFRVILV